MEIGQRKILPLACILLLHASSLFAFSVFGYTYSIQNTTNADLTVNINLAGTSSSSFDKLFHGSYHSPKKVWCRIPMVVCS